MQLSPEIKERVSKRKKKQVQANKDKTAESPVSKRRRLRGESLEPRILLSATAIDGTDADDYLYGTAADEDLSGFGGNDRIYGRGGDDLLRGGDGDDILLGDGGDDRIEGGAGSDGIMGGDGADSLHGGDGDDYLYSDGLDHLDGGEGLDTAYFGQATSGVDIDLGVANLERVQEGSSYGDRFVGGDADNLIRGGDGDDKIEGGAGNDVLYGDAGADSLSGGDGHDLLVADADDRLDGGAGYDTVDFSAAERGVDLDLGEARIEKVGVGSDHDDTFRTGDEDSLVYAGAGNDRIVGGDGDDILYGEDGDDTLSGGAGRDSLVGGAGADSLSGGDGDDHIWTDGKDKVDGGDGYDTIYFEDLSGPLDVDLGEMNIEHNAAGSEFDDRIEAGDRDSHLVGGGGDDTLRGGDGHDLIEGGEGADDIRSGDGDDVVDGGEGDNDIRTGSGNDSVRAGGGDDRIRGDAGNDVLDGGEGDNRIDGGSGDDVLVAGAGDDRMYGGSGDDVIYYDGGDDVVFGSFGNDTIIVRDGGDGDVLRVSGGLNSDTLDLTALGDAEIQDNGREITVTKANGDTFTIDYSGIQRVLLPVAEVEDVVDVVTGAVERVTDRLTAADADSDAEPDLVVVEAPQDSSATGSSQRGATFSLNTSGDDGGAQADPESLQPGQPWIQIPEVSHGPSVESVQFQVAGALAELDLADLRPESAPVEPAASAATVPTSSAAASAPLPTAAPGAGGVVPDPVVFDTVDPVEAPAGDLARHSHVDDTAVRVDAPELAVVTEDPVEQGVMSTVSRLWVGALAVLSGIAGGLTGGRPQP